MTVSWETDADLDVYVQAPNGETIGFNNAMAGQGGQLDVDAHAGCARGQADSLLKTSFGLRTPHRRGSTWSVLSNGLVVVLA